MSERIPQDFIDDLIERADIGEVIGRRVEIKKAGKEFKACCPFHNEKTPSFTISPEKGFYHCFGCGAHGTALGFLMDYERLTFVEAIEEVAKMLGVSVPKTKENIAKSKERNSLKDLLQNISNYYEQNLKGSDKAIKYLKSRGIDGKTAKHYALGFSIDSWDDITHKFGVTLEDKKKLLACGLLIEKDDGGFYDRFRNRLMFPIKNNKGEIVGFGGRIIDDEEPKYLNSPETSLFKKGELLYGLYESKKSIADKRKAIIVEGYTDVIGLYQNKIGNSLATLGTATTEIHINKIFRISDQIIFCFDGDNAGQRAAGRAAERALPLLKPGKSIRFAFLPEGQDPDSLLAEQGPAALRNILDAAQPLAEVVWDIERRAGPTDTPERMAGLKARLRQQASRIAEPTVREQYRNLFDERTTPQRRGQGLPGRGNRRWGQPIETRPRTNLAAAAASTLWQRILLAALINHPALIDEFGEQLIDVSLDANLDKLREELHVIVTANPDLDGQVLHCHLNDSGFADILSHVLDQSVLESCAFTRPDAPLKTAREGVARILVQFQHQRQLADHRAFGQQAAREKDTEKSFARFLQQGEIVRELANEKDGSD